MFLPTFIPPTPASAFFLPSLSFRLSPPPSPGLSLILPSPHLPPASFSPFHPPTPAPAPCSRSLPGAGLQPHCRALWVQGKEALAVSAPDAGDLSSPSLHLLPSSPLGYLRPGLSSHQHWCLQKSWEERAARLQLASDAGAVRAHLALVLLNSCAGGSTWQSSGDSGHQPRTVGQTPGHSGWG